MYKIIEKVKNDVSLTDGEVFKFLSFICNEIRKDSNILDSMDSDCKKCDETSLKFGRSMLIKFGCNVDIIDIKNMLEIPLTHYANIISLKVDDTIKKYLVDMTYSQFFGETIILDNGETVSTDVFKNIEHELWVQYLRANGFVELNDVFFDIYINLFFEMCNLKGLKKDIIV